MRKIICVVCFVVFVLTGNAQSLKGTWKVDSVSQQAISNKTKKDGATKILANPSKLESELPIKIIFEDSYFYFTYADGSTLEGGYLLFDNILQIALPDRVSEYEVSEQDGILSLKKVGKETSMFNKISE